MHEIWIYSLVSVFIVSIMSLIGVFTLSLSPKRLKKLLIYMVSFSAGAMLGDAFIHLLPEAAEHLGFELKLSLYVLAGIMFSFAIEQIIHWRHCHLPITEHHVHPVAIMNLVGELVHNFIDGIIIGASYLANIPAGIATTIAVVLHEIPQEISDFGVLMHGGFSKFKALMYNFIAALAAVLGTILALLIGTNAEEVASFLIPFAAGSFIYIAGSDLIPELHKDFEVKKAIMQFLTICLGIAVMVGLLLIE